MDTHTVWRALLCECALYVTGNPWRGFQPLSVSRDDDSDDGDDTTADEIYIRRSRSRRLAFRKAYGKTGRVLVMVSSFVCPQLRRSYWKQLPSRSARHDCYAWGYLMSKGATSSEWFSMEFCAFHFLLPTSFQDIAESFLFNTEIKHLSHYIKKVLESRIIYISFSKKICIL